MIAIRKKLMRLLKDPIIIWLFLASKFQKLLFLRKVKRDGDIFFKYKGDFFPGYLNSGNAAQNIKQKALEYCSGRGLDIGAGSWALDGAIAIDNNPDQNALKLDRFGNGSLDYIFSSHCLEHLSKWREGLKLWISKLKPEGILFLYLPHVAQKLWRPGGPWVGHAHRWSPTVEVVVKFLEDNGMTIIETNKGMDRYYSFHVVAKKK
ncbi:MAG: methyltransferase domain-containing protein [Candidatus Omnitrophota bacterium]